MKNLIFIRIALLLASLAFISCSSSQPANYCSRSTMEHGKVLLKEARTYMNNKEYNISKELTLQALQVFKNCNMPYWEAVAYEHFGYTGLRLEENVYAKRYFSRASDIYHQLSYPLDNSRLELEEIIQDIPIREAAIKGVPPKTEPTMDERLNALKKQMNHIEDRLNDLMRMVGNGSLQTYK